MMKRWVLILIAVLIQGQLPPERALAGGIPPVIKQALPDVEVIGTFPIEITSPVYAVITRQGVLYMDAGGRHLFTGELYDLATQENLTQSHRLAIPRVEFDQLPLADAFLYQKGKHRIAIFDDPDCPYCRKLHKELSGLDAGIHVFLYPLTDLHPLAYRKSVSVWCSENRAAAMDLVMADQPVEVRDCDHPVDRNLALGARLGVRATPTIILEDGRWIEGYRPARELIRLLEAN